MRATLVTDLRTGLQQEQIDKALVLIDAYETKTFIELLFYPESHQFRENRRIEIDYNREF